MEINFKNIKYRWNGTILEPANGDAQYFNNALPENFLIELDTEDMEKGLISFLNFDDSPSFTAFSYMRENLCSILEDKTNIPEDLINDAYMCQYKRGEELAFLLRFYVEDIKKNEKTGNGPNVTKTITRSELNFIVADMIENLIGEENPQLIFLLRSLLNLNKAQKKIEATVANNNKKRRAFELKVEYPELSIQKIADIIGVDRSTTSKWFSADDAEDLIYQTKHNLSRIYIYWVQNKDLNLNEIASNLDIKNTYLIELKKNKHHKKTWELYSSIEKISKLAQP